MSDSPSDNPSRSPKRSGTRRVIGYVLLVLIGSAIGSFAFLLFSTFIISSPAVDSILSAHGLLIKRESMTEFEKNFLDHMVSRGHILPPEGLIGNIVQYYSSIIDYLIGIIAVTLVFGFLYIKFNSDTVIEETVDNKMQRATSVLMDSKVFHDLVDEKVNQVTSIYLDDIGDKALKLTEASKIADRLEKLLIQAGKIKADDLADEAEGGDLELSKESEATNGEKDQ